MSMCDTSNHNKYCYDQKVDKCDGFYDCPHGNDESDCGDAADESVVNFIPVIAFFVLASLFAAWFFSDILSNRLDGFNTCMRRVSDCPRAFCTRCSNVASSICTRCSNVADSIDTYMRQAKAAIVRLWGRFLSQIGCKEEGNSPREADIPQVMHIPTANTDNRSESPTDVRRNSSSNVPTERSESFWISLEDTTSDHLPDNASSSVQPSAPGEENIAIDPMSSPPSYGEYENYAPVDRSDRQDNAPLPPTYSEALQIVDRSRSSGDGSRDNTSVATDGTSTVPPPSYDSIL